MGNPINRSGHRPACKQEVAMEYVEFFFGNFWHWLGLVVIIAIIFGGKPLVIKNKEEK